MNGFAFAAIYKEPDTPGPGPHIDGPVIDDEDEKEKDNTTYTISGTSITPFVPFTVTVTASNSKGKGNGGHLQSSFSYEVISDGGKWESGTTHTWNLFTRVCDKNIQTVQFAWLISGREPVRATLNYNCGSMTPAISGAVIIGKTFNFSITFAGHGEDCLARNLSDFGATYWWEARKNNTWERTNRIAVNQTPSFSQGVLSGVAHVGNLVGYDRIRLCVDYAGLATAYAEAAITSAAVTITLGDDSLHVWGPSTTLKIESESLQYMTAEFKRGGNATQDITDTNGDPIAFTFSGQTWTGDIQAATSAAEGTVKLVVKYGNEIVKEQEIGIETEFLADISVSSNAILQGDTFDMNGSVSSTLGSLTRIPLGAFSLVAVQGNSQLASVSNAAGSQEVEYEGVTPTTTDMVYVRIIDNRDETTVAEAEVAVQSIKSALADAINERILAKTGENGTYVKTDTAGTLRTGAINAIKDYVKGAVAANGTFIYFDNSNHGIDMASDTVEWYKNTYNIVKSAVAKQCFPTTLETRQGSRYSGQKQTNISGSGTQADPYVLESESDFKARVVSEGYDSNLDDDECASEYDSYLHAMKKGTYEAGWVSGNMYASGYASMNMSYQCRKYTLTPHVSGTVDMYFESANKGSVYNTFGHSAPSAKSTTAKCGSFQATAGQASPSGWFGGDGSILEPQVEQIGSGGLGYCMTLSKAVITYNFKHK